MAANAIDFLTKQDWIDKFPLFIDSIDDLLLTKKNVSELTRKRVAKLRVVYNKVISTDLSRDEYTNCMKTIINTLIWLKYRTDLTQKHTRMFNPSCLVNRGNGEWYVQKSRVLDDYTLDPFLIYCFDEIRKKDKTFRLGLNSREIDDFYWSLSSYYEYLRKKNAVADSRSGDSIRRDNKRRRFLGNWNYLFDPEDSNKTVTNFDHYFNDSFDTITIANAKKIFDKANSLTLQYVKFDPDDVNLFISIVNDVSKMLDDAKSADQLLKQLYDFSPGYRMNKGFNYRSTIDVICYLQKRNRTKYRYSLYRHDIKNL